MEEVFYDASLVTPAWVESVRRPRHHARPRPPRPALRPGRQARQRRGPAGRGPGADPHRVGPGGSHHAPRRGRAIPRAAPAAELVCIAALRPRAHAGAARASTPSWGMAPRDVAAPGAAGGRRPRDDRAGGRPLLDWMVAAPPARPRARERGRPATQEQRAGLARAPPRDTEFGLRPRLRRHPLGGGLPGAGAARAIPRLRRSWARACCWGAQDLTWPGRPRYWVKTSGTTAGGKILPITPEALASHRKGGWDAILMAAERVGRRAAAGRLAPVSGREQHAAPHGEGGWSATSRAWCVRACPRSSAAATRRARRSPPSATGRPASTRWPTRARGRTCGSCAGMPSWILVLFDRIARAGWPGAPRDPRRVLAPLKVFIHGGVAFAPYRAVFEQWIGRRWSRGGLSRLGGLRRAADGARRRPDPHAGLRDLLRVHPGRGPGRRAAPAAHRGRRRAGPRLCGGR